MIRGSCSLKGTHLIAVGRFRPAEMIENRRDAEGIEFVEMAQPLVRKIFP